MRSAILVFAMILAFASTPSTAQNIKACSSKAAPAANTDRLTGRLKLNESQKHTLKDLADASASADESVKKASCTDKADRSTAPGRMAYAEKMAEARLAGLKAVGPKLQAFYDSLEAKQRKAFDTG